MKKVIIILAAIISCLCFTNCTSPKSQGEKLGKEHCDCQKEYAQEKDKAYQDFLAKFDSYGFKNRTEARLRWQNLQDDAKRKFEGCTGKVGQKVQEARAKFPTDISNLLDPKIQKQYMKNPQKYLKEFSKNQEKARAFETAYRNAINQCGVSIKEQDHTRINEKILTIIPQKPDVATLKQNLVGRRILEQSGGYFGSRWAWQISSIDEIKDIKIEKTEKNGDDYELDVHLVLQKESQSQYKAELNIICVLGQEDDWRIDFIKTKDIHIVKTGRYDDCIKTEIKKGWGTSLQFTNSCDVPLIVGGQILGNKGEWTKFSTNVNANSTSSKSYNGKQYKIEFIERQ